MFRRMLPLRWPEGGWRVPTYVAVKMAGRSGGVFRRMLMLRWPEGGWRVPTYVAVKMAGRRVACSDVCCR